MQAFETEVIIPLKRRPDPRSLVALSCLALVLIIGEFIYFTVIPLFSSVVNIGDFLSSVIVFLLMLALFGVLLTVSIRQLRTPSPYMRISREGVFTSRGSFLIRWSDIKELSVLQGQGSHYVRIVLRDAKEVFSRANLLSRSFILAGIDLRTLPISLDELMTVFQERFAAELREHSISISGWRHQVTNNPQTEELC